MKKFASLILLAVILILSFIGLSKDSISTNTVSPPSGTQALHDFKDKELNIAVFQGGYGREYWDEIVSEFESAYPGVKVNMTNSPRIGDVVRPQIVAGNPPDFLVVVDTEQSGLMTSLVKEKGLLDISDVFESKALDKDQLLKDMVLPGMLESTRFSPYQDGEIYLAPFNAGPMGLIYNKKLFRDKGWKLPETWDEFFALDEELKKEENYLVDTNGVKTKRALFTYQGIYPDYLEEIMYPSLANAAGINHLKKIFAYEPGSFKTRNVKKVLDTFAKLGTQGYLMEGTVDLNHTQSQTDMMLGKAIFIVNATWMENEMKNSPREEGFEFGMIPVPVFNKGDKRYILTSYEQFSIPLRAKNPELAKEFLKFLYTDQSVKLFAEKSNGVFALKDAKELSKPYLTPGVYEMFSAYDGATTILQDWKAIPKGSKIDIKTELFRNTMTPIMAGKMTTDQWMDSVEKSFTQIQSEMEANKH
ncbi:carbohydrate ABC transporter substrate-binding protein [Paenibacillus macquariensis]|uniref:Carbohydrate ABC transporter substrate-binding protein, CUT1 family n=1 Tax=Paenibacillus macquariensis TaxID=948756 RepID=A0ABY1JZL2_9BACL|nr:carbohydrate ABC transporter substrate-binding protein [Paenibacillus macquariensis]MEC0091289.1 carbohydrate ABC transporter substrate-binding protein [Paenibacillus macquariensis]OAB37982.1 carbohydrate ABC transporter substrate-binding protein [Paenibacillus macquariensis subsp. macquariensis]SIR03653.1 carbohydrate ABC transporter substrate-binding protein, CUT1 family [Paenibacillus macquariensis]